MLALWSRSSMNRGLVSTALALLAMPGCISQTTLIRVKPDGSGTLTQTVAMRVEMADGMRDMSRGFEQGRSNQTPAKRPQELFPESRARALAAELGKGVTFVSSEPIKSRDVEGQKAVYAFQDIEALRVVQEPNPPGLAGIPLAELARDTGLREPLTFRFDRRSDGSSVVTAVFPPPVGASERDFSEGGGEGESAPSGPLATQTRMLKGLRVVVILEVEGKVLRSSSRYVQGSSVTLTDVDFDLLLADAKRLWQLRGMQDLETAKIVLKDIKGMKVHLDPVTVEFAAR